MEKSIYSKSYEIFLERLKQARLDSGLSQKEVADRIGRTQSFVSKCERGERRIDIVEMRAFCGAIGISFHRFMTFLDKELDSRL